MIEVNSEINSIVEGINPGRVQLLNRILILDPIESAYLYTRLGDFTLCAYYLSKIDGLTDAVKAEILANAYEKTGENYWPHIPLKERLDSNKANVVATAMKRKLHSKASDLRETYQI